MFLEIAVEQYAQVLDEVAEELLDRAALRHPPVDTFEVARRLGIMIAQDARQPGRARCVRLASGNGNGQRPTILLRPDPRSERLQWAVAHEVGEFVAWQVFDRLAVDPAAAPAAARESISNQLAGRILLPRFWFHDRARECDGDLFALKASFSTASHELISRRMLDLALPVAVTIIDNGSVTFRRSNVPGRVPPLSAFERECLGLVHETAQPHSAEGDACRIRGWPIHEPGWHREILITELPSQLMEAHW